jgi:uncharacterized protein (TIGR00375 family)
MSLEQMARWAKLKGVHLVGTGDFTHPAWFLELKEKLAPAELEGLYQCQGTLFILTAEVANFFNLRGRSYKMHNLIFAPSLETALRINQRLRRYGSLSVDGRPALTLSAHDLLKIVKDLSTEAYIVPAHVWTPWFSLFGSRSGFDSIADCFGEDAGEIFALETGLSSDPPMNWRWSALDRITLLSNSDAHSPSRLGREANVFAEPTDFVGLRNAIASHDAKKLLYTIEFFPEEGKYHYDGHRLCNVLSSPAESRTHHNICPVCHKPLTVGVMHRVEELADRPEGFRPPGAIPYRRLIPLEEVIAQVTKRQVGTVAVENEYMKLVQSFGSELNILMDTPVPYLEKVTTPELARAISLVRQEQVSIIPGFDGIYGKIEIRWKTMPEPVEEAVQIHLF